MNNERYRMGLGSWPITLVLWAAGALLVFFTRQGISRDNRISIGIAALFFLLGIAVLLDSPIMLAFLICIPLGAGMIWAGILPIWDAANFNIPVEGIYRGSSPEIEGRKSSKQLLTFSYTIDDAHLTGTSVDAFTPGQIERDFEMNKPAKVWVNRKDLASCKVHRFESIVLVPFALVVGAIFVAIPFIRLAAIL
jgi:hypothetical protein